MFTWHKSKVTNQERAGKNPSASGLSQTWWNTLLIAALVRKRQGDLCEFKASLVYRISSRTGRAAQRNPVSKANKQEQHHPSTVLAQS